MVNRSIRPFFALPVLLLAALNAFAQERYLLPVDQAKKDPSFVAFRTKLIEAAKNRDAKYLLSIVDPKIRIGFGGSHGIADFKKEWKPEDINSNVWPELLVVLSNGGRFYKERGSNTRMQFYAPYTFTSFPDDLDSYEYMAIIGKSVNLRAEPKPDAKVVASLSYNIVKADRERSIPDPKREGKYTWYRIESLGGLSGFVKAEFARSPIDYRAAFNKKNGNWKMTAFIAGD